MRQDTFYKDSRLPFVEFRSTADSSASFRPHLHHAFCIGAVQDGSVTFKVDTATIKLRSGSLCLLNPDTLHSCNSRNESRRSFSMLYLQADWCRLVQQSIWCTERFAPVDCFVVESFPLYSLYRDTSICLTQDAPVLQKEQMLVALLEAVFARCCPPNVPEQEKSSFATSLKEILAADLHREMSLTEIGEKLQQNPFTLLRQFKRAHGVTPHAFRMNCRVEYARKLLQQGVEPAEVAQLCGFFDQSHLHKFFKAMTSVTPGEYQRSFIRGEG